MDNFYTKQCRQNINIQLMQYDTNTSSPSGQMNGSWLRWSIPLQWMTPLSGNQDSTYPDATGPTKATAHPVERSEALQQRQTISHIVDSCPQSKLEAWLQHYSQLMTLLPNG